MNLASKLDALIGKESKKIPIADNNALDRATAKHDAATEALVKHVLRCQKAQHAHALANTQRDLLNEAPKTIVTLKVAWSTTDISLDWLASHPMYVEARSEMEREAMERVKTTRSQLTKATTKKVVALAQFKATCIAKMKEEATSVEKAKKRANVPAMRSEFDALRKKHKAARLAVNEALQLMAKKEGEEAKKAKKVATTASPTALTVMCTETQEADEADFSSGDGW
jgi:hypothetical protein